MTAESHDRTPLPLFDGNMAPPAWVLHFFPVALAIFGLTLSLSYYSVFRGFEEDEPGTWMSLFLMFSVFLLVLPAIRNTSLPRGKRWLAAVLTAMCGYAIVDEKFAFHEDLGDYVEKEIRGVPEAWGYYSDDIMVIIYALVGGIMLAWWLRRSQERRAYSGYAWSVVAVGLAHGVLDVMGHGRRFIWKAVFPEMTRAQVHEWMEVTGYFEETCKLWCEWFVVLLVLRVLYEQRGALLWSWLVFLGSLLATIGLWGVVDPERGIPYLLMERTLRYIRNYDLLFMLGAIWALWAIVVWWRFRDDAYRRSAAGLFFVTPGFLLLPEMTQLLAVGARAVGVGVLAGAGAALLVMTAFRRSRAVAGGLLLLGGVLGFSLGGLTTQPLRLLEIGGVLLPAAVVILVVQQDRKALWIAGVAAVALLVHNQVVLLVGFGVILLLGVARLGNGPIRFSRPAWAGLLAVQVVTILLVAAMNTRPFIGCGRFRAPETVMFEIGYQPFRR